MQVLRPILLAGRGLFRRCLDVGVTAMMLPREGLATAARMDVRFDRSGPDAK